MQLLKLYLWPRSSFRRSFIYYLKRLSRMQAGAHSLALGFAIGIFLAFSPLLGVHFILAISLAWALSANITAAIIGTAFANPLTLPFMWGAGYKLGAFLLHQGSGHGTETIFKFHGLSWKKFFSLLTDTKFSNIWYTAVAPWLLGCTILGLAFAIISYLLIKRAIIKYREKMVYRKHAQSVALMTGKDKKP